MDAEGRGRGLIWGIITPCACRDLGKSQIELIFLRNILKTSKHFNGFQITQNLKEFIYIIAILEWL
jgi:hypothetical protein